MEESAQGRNIREIILRRGMCYGECPVYEVSLRRDGQARWDGRMYVARVGVYAGQFSPWQFERLASFVERCGFFGWSDRYETPITDMPEFSLTARYGRRRKRVEQYGTDEPADFWVIAALIDHIADRIAWQRDESALEPRTAFAW